MGKHNTYTDEKLASAVASNVSIAGVLRYLGIRPAGGSHSHISRRIKALGLNTSHFRGQSTNSGPHHRGGLARRSWQSILVLRTSGGRTGAKQLRKALIESGREYRCEGTRCNSGPTWLGLPMTLQVEHRNRNWLDDRQENLLFLCPNCHSQTEGWSGRKPRDPTTGKKIPNPKSLSNCPVCTKTISSRAIKCKSCSKREQGTKIEWPDILDLKKAVGETSYEALGRKLGVSGNAVRKRIKTQYARVA